MAETSKQSPKAGSSTGGESTDEEFDLTPEMMIHEFDDEETLDEEELLASNDSFDEELDDLQKEGDMPLEELLALYNYTENPPPEQEPKESPEDLAKEGNPDHSAFSDPVPQRFDPPNEEDMNTLPDLVNPVEEQSIAKMSIPVMEKPLFTDSSPGSPASNINASSIPENQRITRGLAAAYVVESESSDSDSDYSPSEDWKKEIQIGPDYQAEVPDTIMSRETEDAGVDAKCLWSPHHLTEPEVQSYLNTICHPPGIEDFQPRIDMTRDDEQALYLLFQCNYSVQEALKKRQTQTNPPPEMALWSEEECRNFESGLRVHGKDFRQIQQSKVPARTVGEIVQFYYLWKKTERHDAFACQTRLGKKKYAFHPGITDYMDRFLDENESAASSRCSSPHGHTQRRIGNGPSSGSGPGQVAPPTTGGIHVSNNAIVSLPQSASRHSGEPDPKPPVNGIHSDLETSSHQNYVPTPVIVSSESVPTEQPPMRYIRTESGMHRINNQGLGGPPPLKPISSVSHYHTSISSGSATLTTPSMESPLLDLHRMSLPSMDAISPYEFTSGHLS